MRNVYLVSVIIPNYNRAEIIGETIQNMLSQTLSPHEIIVVDDGSTDKSIEVIQSFGNRVKLLQQSNKGPGAARNAGLKIATGEFIQFMDSDDLASLNKLEVQVNALNNTNADIALGPWVKAWFNKDRITLENVVLQQNPLPLQRSPLLWFLTDWSMVFQQCLVRKKILDKIGGYRKDMKFLEDGDLFVRLLIEGAKVTFEQDSLTFYRLDDYGKLTASGQKNTGRILDTVNFYNSIFKSAENNTEIQKCLAHPKFRLRVWEAIQELENQQVLNNYSYLYTFKTNKLQILYTRLKDKVYYSLQQRIKGHRWPNCYQPRSLSVAQKGIIRNMGWMLSE